MSEESFLTQVRPEQLIFGQPGGYADTPVQKAAPLARNSS
jgi:hypothetical protein